jgi:hypothetical protein
MKTGRVALLALATGLTLVALAALALGLLDDAARIIASWAIPSLLLGALVAVLLRSTGRRSLPTGAEEALHGGPNMSHIPLAGFPGLVFAIGFVWMFWFGVPSFRPLVVAIVILGGVTGLALVLLARRHQVPTDTPLGLSGKANSAHGDLQDCSASDVDRKEPHGTRVKSDDIGATARASNRMPLRAASWGAL